MYILKILQASRVQYFRLRFVYIFAWDTVFIRFA